MFGKTGKSSVLKAFLLSFLLSLSPSLSQRLLANQAVEEVLPGQRVAVNKSDNCLIGKNQLTALIPKNNLGLTTAAYPTFFFYIPRTATAKMAEFVLRDEDDHQVYRIKFITTDASGIINFALPDTVTLPALKTGKKYHWYFSIFCDRHDRSEDIFVEGWIKRVEPNPVLVEKLTKVSPLERAALYASSDLWHEALLTIADLRQKRPQDLSLNIHWTNLLQSVGLGSIAKEEFSQKTSPQKGTGNGQ